MPRKATNGSTDMPLPGGSLGDFERFAAVADTAAAPSGEPVTCRVGPPGKMNFIRSIDDPAFHRAFHFLQFETDGKRTTYLVAPNLCGLPEIEGRTALRCASPYVTHHGAIGLWLISAEHEDNSWVQSAQAIVEAAKTRWVAAIPVKRHGAYTLLAAARDLGEPEWPDLTLAGWLSLAFPPAARIEGTDHPLMAALRGE